MSLLDSFQPVPPRNGEPDHDHALLTMDMGANGDLFVPLANPVEGCPRCDREAKCCFAMKPVRHYGSKGCQSGSLASGGTRSHCTCDRCF